MAKAKQIEGLDCDAHAAAMAAKVLRMRFDEILEFRSAALAPDGLDSVHDMRVASRRFRSALRDFAPLFDKKAVKPLKKQVKKVADALGDVRDQDVAIEALGSLRERAPNEAVAGGIDLLIEARRARRSDAHAELVKQVTPDRLTRLCSDLEDALDPVSSGQDTPQTFREFGAEAIDRAVEKFLDRAASIYEPFNDPLLHKLRLSTKRLRYALELFNDCYGGDLKSFAKHFSKMQSALGEVHDSSEWIAYLGGTIRDGCTLDRQTAAWLISEFVCLRTTEYLKALELWNAWLASDLTGRLRGIIGK